MTNELFAILVLIAAAHGFFISVLLVKKSGNYLFLALIVSLASYDLGTDYIYFRELDLRYPALLFTILFSPLLYGPLLWLFVRNLADEWPLVKKDWFHFLPALLSWLIFLPDLFESFENSEYITTLYQRETIQTFDLIYRFILLTQILIYCVRAFFLLGRQSTNRPRREYQVIQFLILFIGLSVLVESGTALFYPAWLAGIQLTLTIDTVLLVYLLGYIFLKKEAPEPVPAKYAKTLIPDDELKILLTKARRQMVELKSYENPDLTLEEFAKILEIPTHRLSQALNRGLNKNFYRFLNEYRVARVQADLKDPARAGETILNIALAAGFNSKANFNQIFKEYTGLTPSKFRKENS